MRSVESLRQRAQYAKAWRLANPNYHKNKRVEKDALQKKQHIEWRVANPDKLKAQKQRYTLKHPTPPISPIPSLHIGHPLFEVAHKIVTPYLNPMALYKSQEELDREDARSEAILAMLEGSDPARAADSFLKIQKGWRRITIPLLGEGHFEEWYE